MRRILVVGTSGAGKTTLATRIASRLRLPFHATDPLYWQSNWQPSPQQHVDAVLAKVLAADTWVMDGNFEAQWQSVWPIADSIVWLDYSLPTVLWQVTRRNFSWALRRQEVWSGNRMSMSRAWSGVCHAAKTHARERRQYPLYFATIQGKAIHRFTSRRQTQRWLNGIAGR